MVNHAIFGVQRDIDIPKEVFPSKLEIEKMESYMPGCEHGWFDSVHDRRKLHYRKFLPRNGKPKAIIIWMHGVQTHCGRAYVDEGYRKFNMALLSETCSKQGWALYAHDMIGHGYSEGPRFYLPKSEEIRDDYLTFIKLVASMHEAGTPMFLVGESFGGCLTLHAADYFQEHPSEKPSGLNGIIFLAPALHVPPGTPLFILLLEYLVTPFVPLWRFPTFIPNPVSPNFLWRDKNMLYRYAQEKRMVESLLEPGYKHANFGTSLTLLKCIQDARRNIMPRFKIPIAVVHGTGDKAIRKEGSSEYFLKLIITRKENVVYKLIDGGYHDLLADPANDEVIQFIIDYINERLMDPNNSSWANISSESKPETLKKKPKWSLELPWVIGFCVVVISIIMLDLTQWYS